MKGNVPFARHRAAIIVMSPLELMQRLAALVPPPRLHLIRFHGVLAPHAKLRAAIVPSPVDNAPQQASEHTHALASPARLSWACLLKRVFEVDIERCPTCGGALKILAAIVDPPSLYVSAPTWACRPAAPPRSPARRLDLF
ncbi:MAG: transposase [Burkholderiales bacterium]